MASGGEGYGEPPAGDHLQSVYRLWLVGHQLANVAPPWEDPYSFQPLTQPQTVLAGWPFGLLYWPLGALFGLLHGIVSCTALVNVLLPVVHPRMGSALSAADSSPLLEPPSTTSTETKY